MIVRQVTYGEGGYDPNRPDDNIVSVEEIEVPDPPTPDPLADLTPEQVAAIRDALGL